ncbi:hypothetical protein [Campylobacter sp. RM16704]|uniref:hypothetical protein n=1 Tax=Campylobacter sp. RM16704 TaxID=1500960 RepID=UPI00057F8470|nr:hypothetical protein [Campylobacter sp. RM16704]AJC86778.1 hypothetical protein CAQ16704_1333 [Campylobacter sp. RM16704]
MNNKNIFFKNLHNIEFVFFKNCYTTCNGYCCKNFHSTNFNFLNQEEVIIPLLESEFQALNSIQKKSFLNFKEKIFTLQNGKKIKIYFLKCSSKGLCFPHYCRPLLCKIYPYFPIVDFEGNFLGVRECAFLDLFYKNDTNHPCTLINQHKQQLIEEFEKSTTILRQEPIMIFVFMVLKCLDEALVLHFSKKFQNKIYLDKLNLEEKKLFFKIYEHNALTFEAWKTQEFSNKVVHIYNKLEQKYGEEFTQYFFD